MKSIVLTTLLFFSGFIIAQTPNKKIDKNIVSTDVLRIATSDRTTYRTLISFERKLSQKVSILLGIQHGQHHYGELRLSDRITDSYNIKGNMLLLEGRYYPFKKDNMVSAGWFLAHYLKYYNLEENYDAIAKESFSQNHHIFAYGLSIGYQIKFHRLIIEPIVGFGFTNNHSLNKDKRIAEDFRKSESIEYRSRAGINLGISF